MRTALTLFALLLIALLTAALVGPWFVDWSAHRAYFEAELSRQVGARVKVAGPIDARLLPTPYLSLGLVTVGGAAGGGAPWLRSQGARFELALGSLASGQIRFTEVDLDRPAITIALGPDGSIPKPRAEFAGLAERLSLDRLVVRQGRLALASADADALDFEGVDLDASAKSFLGPFRGSGGVTLPGGARTQFQFASAEVANSALPIKLEIDSGPGGARAVLEGAFHVAAGAMGLEPSYVGSASLAGSMAALDASGPAPWKVSGSLHLDSGGAELANLVASFGADQRALEATGAARAEFGDKPSLRVDLKSKQLNVDALLRREGEVSAPPERALRALRAVADALARRGGPPGQVRLTFQSPAAFLGAQTIEDIDCKAVADPGQPIRGQVEAGLPGRGHVKFAGTMELGAAPEFRGVVDAHVGDPAALADWLSEGAPVFAERMKAFMAALPYSEASATGDLEASGVGFSLRNLKLGLDRTNFAGALAFTQPVDGARGRVFLDLRTDALDIDSAPDLTGSGNWFGDFDVSLALEAAKLRIARVGQTAVEGGSLSLKAGKSGDRLSLDKLAIADLGGASIEAQGESTPGGRWGALKLDAAHLADFAQLVARVAPGRYSRMLAARADQLSPAKAVLEARREGAALDAAFPFDFVKAEGEAGASRFSVKLSSAPAPVDAISADLTLDAPEGGALLRQLGLKAPSTPAGRAHVAASASGKWDSGFDATLNATFAGAEAGWRGRIAPNPQTAGDATLFGSASLKSDNLFPLLAALGLAAPNAGLVAPTNLAGDIVLRGAEATLPRLSGTLGGAKLTANLSLRPPAAPVDAAALDPDVAIAQAIAGEAPAAAAAQVAGDVFLDHASLSALLALPLGFSPPARPGMRWSDASFAPPAIDPPPSDVTLKIGALDFGDGAQARNVQARVRMGEGKFEIGDLAMDLAGGRVSGRATLRRDGRVAAVTGKVDIDAFALDRPAFHGKFGASLEFATAGASPSALVAGLVGQGQIDLVGASLPHLDPSALDRVMARAQSPEAQIDETNLTHSLGLELDKQPLGLPDGVAPAVLSSGIVRAGPIVMANPAGRTTLSGEFDLRSLQLGLHALFEQGRVGKFWSGAPPSVQVSLEGSLDAPTRKIDDAMMVAGLAAQAIARESDRIAALEADLRERAYFNRVLKAQQFMARRDAEIAEYEVDQARLKFDADRQRVADGLERAYEEEQKAAAARAAEPAPAAAPEPPPAPARPPAPDAGTSRPKAPVAPDLLGTGLY